MEEEGGIYPPNLISGQMYFNMQQYLSYKPSVAPKATRSNHREQLKHVIYLLSHKPLPPTPPLPGAVWFA